MILTHLYKFFFGTPQKIGVCVLSDKTLYLCGLLDKQTSLCTLSSKEAFQLKSLDKSPNTCDIEVHTPYICTLTETAT